MTITIAANSVPKPPADIIEGFRVAPTSIISDNLGRLPQRDRAELKVLSMNSGELFPLWNG